MYLNNMQAEHNNIKIYLLSQGTALVPRTKWPKNLILAFKIKIKIMRTIYVAVS